MGQELTTSKQQKEIEKSVAASVLADFGDDDDLQIPILKVAQPLTTEVSGGEARPGEFINSLTGETYPAEGIEFIISGFDKGRFRTNDDGEVICTGREGACGCHAVAYDECPDSEEQFRAAVKRGDKEWGSGPPCATTYNFTGFVIGSDMPVRLSLKRSGATAAKKLLTMVKFGKSPWDRVYELSTSIATSKKDHKYQAVNVRQGRTATPEERQAAVSLAMALRTRNVDVVGDEAEAEDRPPEQNVDSPDF